MTEKRIAMLEAVFAAVFELAPDEAIHDARQGATGAWDSLGHVSLITALESEFEVEIAPADSIEITSFALAAEILDELLDS